MWNTSVGGRDTSERELRPRSTAGPRREGHLWITYLSTRTRTHLRLTSHGGVLAFIIYLSICPSTLCDLGLKQTHSQPRTRKGHQRHQLLQFCIGRL
jgi:hypothetical protein